MEILGFIITFIFNFIAVVMVCIIDDIWIDIGVILLQVFFLLYKIYTYYENK